MPGPKPDTEKDNEILELREKGLTFRQIGRVTNLDVKSVFRRYKRGVGNMAE